MRHKVAVKTRRQAQQGGAELQTDSARNRQEVQSDLEKGEASGTSLGEGTTRRLTPTASGRNEFRQEGMTHQEDVVPPETISDRRVRRKWTKKDNSDIMRAYFHSTKCEREKQGYRKRMVIEWRRMRPDMNLTESQLANQLYAIKSRKLLSDLEIREVKQEIAQVNNGLVGEEIVNADIPAVNAADLAPVPHRQGEHAAHGSEEPEKEKETIINMFQENLIRYGAVDPEMRPGLPKIRTNKKTKQCLDTLNAIVGETVDHRDGLEKVHAVVYSIALTTIQCMGISIKDSEVPRSKRTEKEPMWKTRIENKINKHRSILTKIFAWENGNNSKKLKKEVKAFLRGKKISGGSPNYHEQIARLKDNIKQKIAMWGKRLRRYNVSNKRKEDNMVFLKNEKRFYKQLEEGKDQQGGLPEAQNLEQFWSEIWRAKGVYNNKAVWLEMERERCASIPEMEPVLVQAADVMVALKRAHNWKAAGIDHIHNYWWKKVAIWDLLAHQINKLLGGETILPAFLTKGRTTMLPKSKDTENPKNYRPITCLPTLYKIITSIIGQKISIHLERNNILTEEQKGCRYRSQGCKEQLIIDTITTQDARLRMRNLSVAWIDYQKAFD